MPALGQRLQACAQLLAPFTVRCTPGFQRESKELLFRWRQALGFSLLVNRLGSEAEGRAIEDRVAAALNTFPEAPAAATFAPGSAS